MGKHRAFEAPIPGIPQNGARMSRKGNLRFLSEVLHRHGVEGWLPTDALVLYSCLCVRQDTLIEMIK